MGIKRTKDSGRVDSRGHRVMVSDKTEPTRAAASAQYRNIYDHTSDKPADQLSPGKQQESDMIASLIDGRKNTVMKNGKKVIALDIDGVMADFNAAMKPYSTAPDHETTPENYNFVSSGWFPDFEEFEQAHVTVMDAASTIPLNDPTAKEAIESLRDNGFEVIAVTARREEWRDETLKFFEAHEIPIASEQLHFMHNKDKTSIHYDYLLDDAPKNIVDTLSNSDAVPVVYR